ncbi:MAG: UDP-N-acetylglucosamine 1-carboxyvinyltransferase [Acidobacteria bacterium]|nr:UDP-N-acetylglucosamine 1-carboxyvinyltransferase [Acidobacteriota bacterium]
MDRFRVTGRVRLAGSIPISGAKNAALPSLCACLLTGEKLQIENVPPVRDVRTTLRLLQYIGVDVEETAEGSVLLKAAGLEKPEAPYDLVKTMRASVLVLGPLLARTGRARVSLPGGCTIGARPIDFHIEALRRMGARIEVEHGYVTAKSSRLRGVEYHFPGRSVTGTENLLMAATLAAGTTVLHNCATEPEVADLARLLRAMGAKIEGAGTTTIHVEGVDALHSAAHRIIPDRIEAGTFLVAAALTGGDVTLRECAPEHLGTVLDLLERCGQGIEKNDGEIRIIGKVPPAPVDMATGPYPEFPTDLQAQFMVLMTQATGTSVIRETIFENRFQHAAELRRMGASISLSGRNATVKGASRLSGACLMATDLRASACLVLAGLVAEGETIIDRVYHVDRGYVRIEEKLRKLGARLERIQGS